ncbi:hypothetical protein GCM10010245_89420 [Streptomyces spectabilis]|uniref:Uncharacterized protein n=1 Tax=Streptomyces spectabilis TaxID=68270 RepID=A0A7W8F072_STRST|nr:hypothetical protein [Streptomyces spectabilis]GGV56487.1 hypothetical protein GCM10010245_89420 [Streptomyces spectabilis]
MASSGRFWKRWADTGSPPWLTWILMGDLLRGAAADRMVRELEGADLSRLRDIEPQVLSKLVAWGLRCRADRDLRIAFSGD